MKKTLIAFLILAAGAAFADFSVTKTVIKQRWPWSHVVDVDYWVDATESADVTIKATYDGCPEGGLDLTSGLIEGGLCAVPGVNHVAWDPEKSGLGSQKLKNLSVTVTAVATASQRKYLVFDLKDGSSTYLATEPDGFSSETGWPSAYKTRYIVFRRIPAGIYQLGYTTEQLIALGKTSYPNAEKRICGISSDFYMAIFHTTTAQHANFTGSYSDNNTGTGSAAPYLYDMRGDMTNAAAQCLWPQNGHHVVDSSAVGKLRTRMAGALPATCVIDLPTEVQWEAAARCGVYQTFLSTGGTTISPSGGDTLPLLQEECVYQGTKGVGEMKPNIWGLYDTLGHCWEATLGVVDATPATSGYASVTDGSFKDLTQKVDPIGRTCTDMTRLHVVACNVGWGWGAKLDGLPVYRMFHQPRYYDGTKITARGVGYRLCVHLKRLVPDTVD